MKIGGKVSWNHCLVHLSRLYKKGRGERHAGTSLGKENEMPHAVRPEEEPGGKRGTETSGKKACARLGTEQEKEAVKT